MMMIASWMSTLARKRSRDLLRETDWIRLLFNFFSVGFCNSSSQGPSLLLRTIRQTTRFRARICFFKVRKLKIINSFS